MKTKQIEVTIKQVVTIAYDHEADGNTELNYLDEAELQTLNWIKEKHTSKYAISFGNQTITSKVLDHGE